MIKNSNKFSANPSFSPSVNSSAIAGAHSAAATGKKSVWRAFIAIAILMVVVFILDQLIKPTSGLGMLLTVLQKGSVYALAAVSMNLLNGFTGLFSLGHAGFMLIGAYTYAIFTIPSEARDTVYQYFNAAIRFSFPETFATALGPVGTVLGVTVAVILAGLVAAFFAYLIGLPVLKLKSDYLAIATLGFAEIIRAIFQWEKLGPVTNGSNLLKSFERTSTFVIDLPGGGVISFSTFVPVLIAVICIVLIVLLVNSTYGRAFKAVRDDEVAAEAMGINLAHTKQLSFCISCFFAGIAGAMMAMVLSIAQASNFKVSMTYEILLMVVLGGIGSITGSIIGSLLFIFASEWWLRGLDSGVFLGINAPNVFRNGFRLVVFSVIIMIVVLFFRKGITGDKELPQIIKSIRARIASRKAGKSGDSNKPSCDSKNGGSNDPSDDSKNGHGNEPSGDSKNGDCNGPSDDSKNGGCNDPSDDSKNISANSKDCIADVISDTHDLSEGHSGRRAKS